jgi:hypothetical protein
MVLLFSSCVGPKGRLQNRLLFHLAHKFGDESQVIHFHKSLQNIVEDQVCVHIPILKQSFVVIGVAHGS